jgi:predicted dithiol-disulfide oxidoreductase (DUF899 family)
VSGLHALARWDRRRGKAHGPESGTSHCSQVLNRTSRGWAHERGWDHLSLVSTAGNNYDADYFGDTSKFSKGMRAQHRVPEGENWDDTIFNVFKKSDGEIRHFWGSEMSFAPTVPNQHHRAGDLVDPLWGLLDMTPEGRGDFFPKVNYE